MIVLTVNGLPKMLQMLEKAKGMRAVERALGRAAFRGAVLVQKEARMGIAKGPKTGRVYGNESDIAKAKKGVKAAMKRVHRASAPGEYPATDTGNLARGVSVVAASTVAPGVVSASVASSARYSKSLEYGTKGMEPRPFMYPSVKKNEKAIGEMFVSEVQRAFAEDVKS